MTVSATGPHAPTRPPVVSRCTAGRWFSSVMEKANAIWKSSSPAGRILEWHRKVLNKHEKLENIWKITVFNSTLSSPPCSVEPLNRLCWFAKTRRTKMCRLRRHGNSMHDTLECCKAWRKRLLWVSDWWFGTFYIFPYIYIGNDHPNWRTHIFQRGWSTTNQVYTEKKRWIFGEAAMTWCQSVLDWMIIAILSTIRALANLAIRASGMRLGMLGGSCRSLTYIIYMVNWCGYGSISIDTFLEGWTSIYQLFWCSPGVQGFDPLPYGKLM